MVFTHYNTERKVYRCTYRNTHRGSCIPTCKHLALGWQNRLWLWLTSRWVVDTIPLHCTITDYNQISTHVWMYRTCTCTCIHKWPYTDTHTHTLWTHYQLIKANFRNTIVPVHTDKYCTIYSSWNTPQTTDTLLKSLAIYMYRYIHVYEVHVNKGSKVYRVVCMGSTVHPYTQNTVLRNN